MAVSYIGYTENILKFSANWSQLVGQELEETFQFVWQEKATEPGEEPEEQVEEDYKITKHPSSAFSPGSSFVGDGNVKVTGSEQPMFYAQSKQPQYMIEVKSIPGAKLYFCPPQGTNGTELRAYYGQAWGIIPGTPTPAQVAILLKAFEKATKLDMKAADAADREYLLLSKQAYLLQDTGHGVKPQNNGEVAKGPEWAKASMLYEAGKKTEAITALKAHVAGKLGVSVDTLSKDPHYNPEHHHDRGVGFGRHLRLGWTRAKLQGLFGKNCHLVHHLHSTTAKSFMTNVVTHNGALLANAVKPYSGVPLGSSTGSSTEADIASGGSANIFAVLRKGFVDQGAMLYFDISILLRTDVYMCGTGDSFGRETELRYLTPESWAEAIPSSAYKGIVSATAHYQFVVRHGVDLREYLHTIVMPNASDCKDVRELCSDNGWLTFAQGRPLNKVVVTKEEAEL
jgi:hypothetical protein